MNFEQFFEQAEHRWSGQQGGLSGTYIGQAGILNGQFAR